MAIKLGLWSVVVFVAVARCCCQEDVLVPDAALAPRNFNPHPYQTGYEGRNHKFGQGEGLLFPLTVEVTSQHARRLEKAVRTDEIDDHPYAILSERRKYKQASRFQTEDNSSASVAYKALAEHAAKVLRVPPIGGLAATYPNPNYSDKSRTYSFAYNVNQDNGDQFSHKQHRDSAGTKGEYRVKLPDGRLQIVSYVANDDGYNADVKYTIAPPQKYESAPSVSNIIDNDIESIAQTDISNVNFDEQNQSYDFIKGRVQSIVHDTIMTLPTSATYSVTPMATFMDSSRATQFNNVHYSNLQQVTFATLQQYLLKY